MIELDVWAPQSVVKVDDTTGGIKAGLHCGAWTVGIAKTGNYVALTEEDMDKMNPDELEAKVEKARGILKASGAHFVIDTINDHFFAVPGYGDAVVHVERRAGRVHIFLHSFSENEISAKEVRSRILEVSSNEETSEGEEGSFCTIYSPISATANSTLNRSGKTVYHSAIEDDDNSEDQIMPKVPFIY